MQVEIKTDLKREEVKEEGLLNKLKKPQTLNVYSVGVIITLTEEERNIVDKHALWDVTAFTSPPNEATLKVMSIEHGKNMTEAVALLMDTMKKGVPVSIKALCKGIAVGFLTPVSASNWKHELRAELLPNLKKYIFASGEFDAKEDRFEL